MMTRRNAFKSVTTSAFGIIVPSIVTTITTSSDNAFALTPVAGHEEAVLSTAFDKSPSLILSNEAATTTTFASLSFDGFAASPTSLYLSQSSPRRTVLDTRNTIQFTFPGFIDRLEFTNLLQSYNRFNLSTRSAAAQLADKYDQNTRKTALFNAMTGMANAATTRNQSLTRIKTTECLNRFSDFLANTGS
jgi:hypothetical protein